MVDCITWMKQKCWKPLTILNKKERRGQANFSYTPNKVLFPSHTAKTLDRVPVSRKAAVPVSGTLVVMKRTGLFLTLLFTN